MRALLTTLTLAAVLAGCSTSPPQTPQTPPDVASTRNTRATVAYQCDGGLAFTAAFLVSPEAVDLHFPDGQVFRLKQKVSGSGFRYGNDMRELVGKGDEAMYTVGRSMPVKCYSSK